MTRSEDIVLYGSQGNHVQLKGGNLMEIRLSVRNMLSADGSSLAVVFSALSAVDFTKAAVINNLPALGSLQATYNQLERLHRDLTHEGPTKEVVEMLDRHRLLRYIPRNDSGIPSFGNPKTASVAEQALEDLRSVLPFSGQVLLQLLVDNEDSVQRLGWLLTCLSACNFDQDVVKDHLEVALPKIEEKISEQAAEIMSHEEFVRAKAIFDTRNVPNPWSIQ